MKPRRAMEGVGDRNTPRCPPLSPPRRVCPGRDPSRNRNRSVDASWRLRGPKCGAGFVGRLIAAIASFPLTTYAATYSLADDFSYTTNDASSTWSYRLEVPGTNNESTTFPLLPSTQRDANLLWGSNFPVPPKMWSEAAGYWGIGRNLTGQTQVSTRNGTHWRPGEVLFHPKAGAGAASSQLVVAWAAPDSAIIDLDFAFGRASEHGNGIGYEITQRSAQGDVPVVSRKNIGSSLTNRVTGLFVANGDQLLFRFDTAGDPGGDICRADIRIESRPIQTTDLPGPAGGWITAGSDLHLRARVPGARILQWWKDGRAIAGATNQSLPLRNLQVSDAGAYEIAVDAKPAGGAMLRVAPQPPAPERFPSPVPRQVFSSTLAEQEAELATNILVRRFAESRRKLAADPYRPAYHFVSPESQMNDPNGLCFWQGRWHLFYQAYPPDEFPDPKDIPKRRQHWGHAVSDDLIHWRDLPYAIYPGIERMCFSGSTVVEPHQVVAFYPGIHAGQMVAVSRDPLLLNWEKIAGNPVIPNGAGDSCIWKEDDTYCGLIGRTLWTSTNLLDWASQGEFYSGAEGACPNFVPIGDRHILLGFSHTLGGLYLLGDYDRGRRRFTTAAQGRFNHGTVSPGGVHAPSAAADGHGGVINILNINDGRPSDDWDQLMSLPQRLTLGADRRLRLEPVAAVATLRGAHQRLGPVSLPANQDVVLEAARGNTIELSAEIDPQEARTVQLNVLRSPNAEEQTSITFYNFDRKLSIWYDTKSVITLDSSRSSTRPDVWLRPPERATAERPTGEPLRLRVFVDRSVVEVFVNERQYLALRVYPARDDSQGVSLLAQGRDARLRRLDVWKMKPLFAL